MWKKWIHLKNNSPSPSHLLHSITYLTFFLYYYLITFIRILVLYRISIFEMDWNNEWMFLRCISEVLEDIKHNILIDMDFQLTLFITYLTFFFYYYLITFMRILVLYRISMCEMDWNNEWVFLRWISEVLEDINHKILIDMDRSYNQNSWNYVENLFL